MAGMGLARVAPSARRARLFGHVDLGFRRAASRSRACARGFGAYGRCLDLHRVCTQAPAFAD